MQDAVPPGTALREMSRKIEESEGHFLDLRPLLLHEEEALAEPKQGGVASGLGRFCKCLNKKHLVHEWAKVAETMDEVGSAAKCITMHIG